jgi:murein L,D-transpeptidase YafK
LLGIGDVFAKAEAGEAGDKDVKGFSSNAPTNLLSVGEKDKSIIVDKSLHRLYIYEGLELIGSYNITTGKAKGDKQKRGDLKTPEGVYFFTELLDGKKLPSRYGVLAVVLDYPNPVDLAKGKTGSGIWLHGTDDPERLERPRDSKGCVVALDEDVLKIIKSVYLDKTPIIISESVEFIKKSAALNKSGQELTAKVKKFLSANNHGTKELKLFAYDNNKVIVAVLAEGLAVYIMNDEADGKQVFSIVDKQELKPKDENVAQGFKSIKP